MSEILYRIETYKVSLDIAFKETCRGRRCGKSLEERELLYNISRSFIANVIKLRCVFNYKNRKQLARRFLDHYISSDLDVLNLDKYSKDPWCKYSIPKWLYRDISSLIEHSEADKLFKSMFERFWWLRLNTLKAPEEKIIRMLELENVEFERDKDLWYLLKISKSKKPIRLLKAVKEYYAIPQDKASCLVVEALKPQYGDYILDSCSAPGLKASLIYMLTEGNVRLTLIDLSRKRISIMRSLLKKLGVSNVDGIIVADSTIFKSRKVFDKALIDAPCSSTGAIGKDPAIRLIISSEDKLNYYSQIQKKLLSNILRYANIIVFATCSIHPKEGEEVIISHMNHIKIVDPKIPASKGYKQYRISDSVARTFPHIDRCDGFFISKMISEFEL